MPPQDLLTALVGEWDGVYRLWLEPGVLRSESPARATIRPVLDGRYVVHDYAWADQDAPQSGTMLLGCDGDGVWHMAWIDTWHTGRSIMACTGDAGPDATVLGGYGGGGQTWAGALRGPCPTSTTSSSRHGTSRHRVRRTRPPRRRTSVADRHYALYGLGDEELRLLVVAELLRP